jgi:putative tricarboxylic transport membrane protein
MEILQHLAMGAQVAFTPANLFYCFLGVFLGTMIGVLPGIGPAGAIAMLLPVTFGMGPASAIIMLAGIYYGSQYGGSISSILVNIPGESSSVVTTLDGYQMARKGRAGPALGIAAFGSFIAGTLAIVPMMVLAVPFSEVAISFGPPEYFALVVLGLSLLVNLARGSKFKGVIMAILGIGLAQVGMDIMTGKTRLTFGVAELERGISLIPLAMGLFGVAEIFDNIGKSMKLEVFASRIKGLFPSRDDWRRSIAPILRGSGLGFFLGLLPGGGAILASFASYALEKRISSRPEDFGAGAIEGVAGPEAANNAAAQSNFIPLFVLGIPSNAVMGLLLGALMIHQVVPGPFFVVKHPEIFWGTVVSMYLGNVMLLVLNVPLIPLWVKLLKVPYRLLYPLILLFCIVGVYSVENSVFDVFLMIVFGIVGYVLRRMEYEMAPLVLAFILGPILENALRQSLLMSQGEFGIFFTRPVSGAALSLAILLFLLQIWPSIRRKKPNSSSRINKEEYP